jgi:ABC-type sugar transport system ATPase subunit
MGQGLERLRLDGITKRFGANRALSGASLALQAGKVLGQMEDNGAGKSARVRIIAGNFRPTAGAVFLDGRGGLEVHMATDRTSPGEVTGLITGAITTSLAKTA